MRSDVSEEPQEPHAHGRSTRAANRGTANGRAPRVVGSDDDEEDATSWDGGDEDEDEPEQMDLDDDDEEDQAEDSSEDEEEPQSLLVTLRYGKGSKITSNGHTTSNGTTQERNGVDHAPAQPAPAPLAGHGEPLQHIPAPIEPPVQAVPPAPPIMAPQPTAPYLPNGVPVLPAVIPAVQTSMPDPNVLPKLDGMFEHNGAQQQPQPYPVGQPVQHPVLPSPTPATNWQ